MCNLRLWGTLIILILLSTACQTHYSETCPSSTPVGLATADEIVNDDSLLFRFPLDGSLIDDDLHVGWFAVSNQCPPDMEDCYEYPEIKYHAAEDYKRPAGTPVYAMADGVIGYSGRAGGYGWLILIDHPQANLYSLYGHLSPSRWKQKNNMQVMRGDLIGYLGDADENGGSEEQPLDPHLHFGIRAGQIADYPARGEWRYMAGWIKHCPQDLGWLHPSLIITSQEIPAGGYPQPEMSFLTRWWLDLLIISLVTANGAAMLVNAYRKEMRFLLLVPGVVAIVVGGVFHANGLVRNYILLVFGVLMLAVGFYCFFRWPIHNQSDQSQTS